MPSADLPLWVQKRGEFKQYSCSLTLAYFLATQFSPWVQPSFLCHFFPLLFLQFTVFPFLFRSVREKAEERSLPYTEKKQAKDCFIFYPKGKQTEANYLNFRSYKLQ